MIALADGLPLVSMPDGRSVSFDKSWIIRALQRAAELHGHDRWPASFALADAIVTYLQQDLEKTRVTLVDLKEMILSLLTSLHYHEIAASFSLPDPPTTLSLLDLAAEAGNGYELVFFQLLQQRLQKMAQSKSLTLKIADLEPCLRFLSHRSKSKLHRSLREEIVHYIRGFSFFFQHRDKKTPLEIELS